MNPTPADEALAREICDKTAFTLGSSWKGEDMGKAWREAAQLIAAHVAAQNYMPQDICMEIRAMLQPWDVVGEPNTTWSLVKKVTDRLKELEAVAAQAPSGLVVDDLIAITERLKDQLDGVQIEWLEEEVAHALAAHKAQPVAAVRGMVEALTPRPFKDMPERGTPVILVGNDGSYQSGWSAMGKSESGIYKGKDGTDGFMKGDLNVLWKGWLPHNAIDAALASARHAMGGEVKA